MRIDCVVPVPSTLGEGAWWDADSQILWWIDIPEGLIHRFTPADGKNRTTSFGEPVGCLAVRQSGGLVVAAKSGFWFFDPDTGEKTKICDPEPDRPQNRFNDGAIDSKGRFWAGTMKESDTPDAEGRLYRLDDNRHVMPWRDNMVTPNGLAFSPDGRRMYFSDTAPDIQTVWACDYDPDTGNPGTPRVFFDTCALPGRPDGATVDAEGCYWFAGFDGWAVHRVSPGGEVLLTIDMPVKKPTRPMFGGPALDVLYVTSGSQDADKDEDRPQRNAGGLFAIYDLGVRGIPQIRFAG